MVTPQQLADIHKKVCDDARGLLVNKGRDYNREQQETDTLFKLSICEKLGIVDNVTQGVLVRLSDKFQRLISLYKDPTQIPANKDETKRDTILDTINYLVFLYIKGTSSIPKGDVE